MNKNLALSPDTQSIHSRPVYSYLNLRRWWQFFALRESEKPPEFLKILNWSFPEKPRLWLAVTRKELCLGFFRKKTLKLERISLPRGEINTFRRYGGGYDEKTKSGDFWAFLSVYRSDRLCYPDTCFSGERSSAQKSGEPPFFL
jgi:hypothetical protein